MIKRLFKFFCAMLMIGLLVTTYALAASATGYSGPKPLTPQLSSDGKTMYNGIPAVVYVADPNPPKNQANIPPPFNLSTPPEKALSTFTINYIAAGGTDPWGAACLAFPASAKTAFNAAAAIWGNLLTSSVPITINACWSNLGSSSILGYSGGGSLYKNFTGAPLTNIWFSSSLANAFHGSDLDATKYDMNITYNSNFTWYYGTDGVVPAGQYDLMSVVLHEIGHGLNFAGSMSYSSGTGSWGYGTGYPNIYDTFMKDGSGNLLTNTAAYANPSTALGTALTSNNVWFHGTNAMAANGGTRVKIYAPSTWAGGSSYSHLDYATFNGTENALMVYAIGSGVARHAPGPVTLGLFKDLGWTVASSSQSLMYANFTGYGLYKWNGTAWSRISTTLPTLMAAPGTNMYGQWPSGTWKWNGSAWSQITTAGATNLTADSTAMYGSFPPASAASPGTWKYNGTAWSRLTTVLPTVMAGSGTSLYWSNGSGTWKWNGSAWSRITIAVATLMTANSTDMYASYPSSGTWKWNGTAWSRLSTVLPDKMEASGTDLYWSNGSGTWKWNGSAWSRIATAVPTNMAGSGANLYGSYTTGTWKWNGTAWTKLTTLVAAKMTGAR